MIGVFVIVPGTDTVPGDLDTVFILIPADELLEQGSDPFFVLVIVHIIPEVVVQHLINFVVGQVLIDPVTGDQPAFVFLRDQQKQDAVVVRSTADTPVIEQLLGVLLTVVTALQIIDGNHHNLRAVAIVIQLTVLRQKFFFQFIGQHIGIVGNIFIFRCRHKGQSRSY